MEAGDLFDGLAINILSHSGYLNYQEAPYYDPLKDEHVLYAISEWENKKEDRIDFPGSFY